MSTKPRLHSSSTY